MPGAAAVAAGSVACTWNLSLSSLAELLTAHGYSVSWSDELMVLDPPLRRTIAIAQRRGVTLTHAASALRDVLLAEVGR